MKSFKIEGRLKGPEYVAITTKAYRLAVDEAWRVLHLSESESESESEGEGEKVGGSGGRGSEEMKMKMNENVNIQNLKKKVSTASTSSTTSVRFNGLDDELMRDLKQVFSRGQDEEYDGLSAGKRKQWFTSFCSFYFIIILSSEFLFFRCFSIFFIFLSYLFSILLSFSPP